MGSICSKMTLQPISTHVPVIAVTTLNHIMLPQATKAYAFVSETEDVLRAILKQIRHLVDGRMTLSLYAISYLVCRFGSINPETITRVAKCNMHA
jgi:hypothetical protein